MFDFLPPLILIFILYIISVRLLGKSALAQLTPHDFAALFFLAYVAFQPIEIKTYTQAVIGIVAIGITHFFISKLTLVNWIKHWIIGQPTVLIKHGEIIPRNLKKNHFSLVELLSVLRTSGYASVAIIEYAFLEPNGDVSIIPKREYGPLTPNDLDIKPTYVGIPLSVVVEGKIQHRNLDLIDKNEDWLRKELKQKGYSQTKHIFFAYVQDPPHSLEIVAYQ